MDLYQQSGLAFSLERGLRRPIGLEFAENRPEETKRLTKKTFNR